MRRFLLALLLMVGLTASMDAQVLGPVGHGNKLGNMNARGETHGLSSGFRGIVEAGVLGLDFHNNDYSPSLQASFGYQFNPYFYSGLAAGLVTAMASPYFYVAVDFRVHFINAVRTPFVALKTGIIDTKPIFGLNLGYRFAINSANAFNISLAADRMVIRYSYSDDAYYDDYSLRICVGYEF